MSGTGTIKTYYSKNYLSSEFPVNLIRQRHLPGDFSLRGRREFWKICYVISGYAENLVNDRVYPIKPGDVYVIHPNDETMYNITSPELELYNLLFQPELIRDELRELKNDFAFFSIFEHDYNRSDFQRDPFYIQEADREVEHIFHVMEREVDRRPHNYHLRLKFLLLDLLLLLSRRGILAFKRDRKNNLVSYVNFMIEENYSDTISLDALAERMGMNKSHLCRVYRSLEKRTVMDVLRTRRIAAAREMLEKEPSLPVGEVSMRCGFKDLSCFYRNFKKECGDTPLDWLRKRNRHKNS